MSLWDYWDRDDLPKYFAYGPLTETIQRFNETPQDAMYAMMLWEVEANARSNGIAIDDLVVTIEKTEPGFIIGSGQDIANALFFTLSRSLTAYGDHIGVSVPRIWEFFCVSTDGPTSIPAEQSWADWHPGIEPAYELAAGDIFRLQSAVEIMHAKPHRDLPQRADGVDIETGMFWFDGRPHSMSPNNLKVLSSVFDNQTASYAEIGEIVWDNEGVPDGNIRSQVGRLNHQLKKCGIPLSYKCVSGNVIKES